MILHGNLFFPTLQKDLKGGTGQLQHHTPLTRIYTILCNFLLSAIFISRLPKMASTVITVEFGTIQHYFNLLENSEACVLQLFTQMKN